MKKIITNLWFDTQAEEAVNFYASVFKEVKIGSIARYGKSGSDVSGMAEGTVMTISFEINGQPFLALNGGPIFKFSEAISFIIECENQEEIDYYWEKLSANPESEQCGWLKDKFGVSWQVVPENMGALVQDPDPVKAEAKMKAMLQMKKIDIETLKSA